MPTVASKSATAAVERGGAQTRKNPPPAKTKTLEHRPHRSSSSKRLLSLPAKKTKTPSSICPGFSFSPHLPSLYKSKAMDRYQNVENPRPEVPIHENEIRITSQGLVRNYISYATGLLQAHACVGGRSVGEEIRRLESGVLVVSRFPGRVCDIIKRRTLRTRAIKMFVLDESDEMLSRGFKEQIYDVYRYLPPELQVVLISVTLPNEILEMASKSMIDPVRILVKCDELTLEGIKHSSLQ
ncbi:hypothetical protein RHMOL_Rhmol05G0210200 [Rhododendron molle]|uniref:Uncharacterized protein n=1 Tax=Rhododendron molle TaxID=49168 RepID=A0ACC0NRM0_RHOML|nr:hypothetical protein RHMOL_Rhmol05G0210200 [Rhododendron molle]